MRICRSTALLLLSALGILVSCEKPMSFLPDSGGLQVAQVRVSPKDVTLLPSQSTQFTAFGRTSACYNVAVAVNWTAQGGAVLPAGLHPAPYATTKRAQYHGDARAPSRDA